MSDFKAKMHQIRFRLAGFEGPTSKGGREKGRNDRGGEGGEGRGEEAFLVMWPMRLSALNPPLGLVYCHISRCGFQTFYGLFHFTTIHQVALGHESDCRVRLRSAICYSEWAATT